MEKKKLLAEREINGFTLSCEYGYSGELSFLFDGEVICEIFDSFSFGHRFMCALGLELFEAFFVRLKDYFKRGGIIAPQYPELFSLAYEELGDFATPGSVKQFVRSRLAVQ